MGDWGWNRGGKLRVGNWELGLGGWGGGGGGHGVQGFGAHQ